MMFLVVDVLDKQSMLRKGGSLRKVIGTLASSGDKVQVGQWCQIERVFEKEDVVKWMELTGDFNPIHAEEQVVGTRKGVVVPGIFGASLIPTLFATKLPGSMYLGQELEFKQPILIGDEVKAKVTVQEVKNLRRKGHVIICETVLTLNHVSLNAPNQPQIICTNGKARVLVPSAAVNI